MKAITAIISTALLLVACSAIPSTSQNDNVFRMNIGADPPTLHPGLATEHTSMTILKSIMEGFTRIGQDGKPQLAAAKQVQLSEDQLTYTFTLRELAWTDGSPVTAADFEYAWKWVLDPNNRSDYAYQLYPILNAEKAHKGELPIEQVGIEAIDARTLVINLENPTPYFLALTANAPYFPVPSHLGQLDQNWLAGVENMIGNGPFRLSEWERGERLILEKNENYWEEDRVNLERVEFTMFHDADVELSLFEKGDLDWIGSPFSVLSRETIAKLKEAGSLKTTPISGAYEFRLNTKQPPFHHPKIRKALAYAIDRQKIVDTILPGRQLPATAYVPPTIFAENKQGLFPDYNIEEANRLLAEGMRETGLNDLPTIELAYQPSETHESLARVVKDMWEQHLGIKVNLKNITWEDQLADVQAGDFQIARISWVADFNDAVNFLEIYTVPEGNNITSWTNDEFNRMIAASYKEIDHDQRISLLKEAEKILTEEMPSIPIYFYTQTYAISDRVKGVYIDPLGNLELKWATTVQQ